MCFHLAQGNHTVLLQQFFWQDKFLCLDSLRISSFHALRIINSRNMIFLQISIHSCSANHCLSGSMTAGICKHNILIPTFTQDSRKNSYYNRMCDHCFLYLCFFQQIRLQQDLRILWNQSLHSTQKIQPLFQQHIDFFFIIFPAGK